MKTLDEVREHLRKLAQQSKLSGFSRQHDIPVNTLRALAYGHKQPMYATVKLCSDAIEADEQGQPEQQESTDVTPEAIADVLKGMQRVLKKEDR